MMSLVFTTVVTKVITSTILIVLGSSRLPRAFLGLAIVFQNVFYNLIDMKKIHHYEIGNGIFSSYSLESLRRRVQQHVDFMRDFNPVRLFEFHGSLVAAAFTDATCEYLRVVNIHPVTLRVTFIKFRSKRNAKVLHPVRRMWPFNCIATPCFSFLNLTRAL